MSVIHPGSSIIFDAANLQNNDDEDEMLQEELRQQKELRELLSAELSDDLLDDDHSSVNDSRQSFTQDAVNNQSDQVISAITSGNDPSHQQWMQNGHVSSAPSQQHQNGYYGVQSNGYGYDDSHQYSHNYGHDQRQYYNPSYTPVSSQPQQWHDHHHQQREYGNGNAYPVQTSTAVGQYHSYGQNTQNHNHVGHQLDDHDEYMYPADQRQVEGREDYGEMIDGNDILQQQQHHFMQFNQDKFNGHLTTTTASTLMSPSTKSTLRQSYPPSNGVYLNGEKHLKNHGKGYNNPHNTSIESSPAEYESKNLTSIHDELNKVCMDPRLDTSGRQMTQLQILYKARGKRIDELTKELDELKSETARQRRMLNHQLAMTKDEKSGMSTSLEKSQKLVCDKDREINDLKGKLDAQSTEIEALKSSKNELLTKIQVSERTIESLHEQLTQLTNSDTIERAREQHDAVLSATTQRHEMQVLELTTQLDGCRQELGEKSDELGNVLLQLSRVSKEAEQTLLDKTETINRLTKSLEDAQKQCQGLLAGSNENALAKHQVSDLLSERKRNEEEIAYLHMQVSEFEDHIKLYENALQLGAGGSKPRHVRGGSMSDSISELMGGSVDLARRLDWKTPPPSKEIETGSQEELIDGLRQELQRALKCNKAKRDEVTKLKAQCSELEDESSHWKSRADEAQMQLKMSASLIPEKLDKEKDDSSAKIGNLEEKLKQAEEEIERLEEASADVKQRMADMIHEHDHDKQDAVERCERALMQLHEDAKQALRDEIVSEYEQKMYELSVEHDAKMREISEEMEQLQHELHDVKQSYVHVCAEKDIIQSTVQQELLEDFRKEKELIADEHRKAVSKLEKILEDMETQMDEKVKEEKEKSEMEWQKEKQKLSSNLAEEWEKEREDDFTQRMETQLALAKVNWFEEFSESKRKAIQDAVKAEEDKSAMRIQELQQQWENEKSKEIKQKLDSLKSKLDSEKDEEIQQLHKEFQSDKETALKTANCMAQLNKNLQKEDQEQVTANKIQEAEEKWRKDKEESIEKAKQIWKAEHEKKIESAIEETKSEMQKKLQEELQTQQSVMEKAVIEVKKVCDQDKHNALKQKSGDMEKEIKKLQEQHRKDYEKFVEEHKNTLASFLEREKSRSKPKSICRDAFTQAEGDHEDGSNEGAMEWLTERKELEIQNKNEVAKIQRHYEEKFESLRKEIQDLMSENNDITIKLRRAEAQSQIEVERTALEHDREASKLQIDNERLKSVVDSSEAKVAALEKKQKDDVNRLKERMRDEYKKWMKERSSLIEKLKKISSSTQSSQNSKTILPTTENTPCKFCQDCKEAKDQILKTKDEATRRAITELTEIYAGTLKMIKDEMMAFINESRGRTRDTISRERKRAATKVKSHYGKAMQKIKPDGNTRAIERLKVYQSDSDCCMQQSAKEPELVKATKRSSKTEENPHPTPLLLDQACLVATEPKSLLIERFLNENEYNQFPTKLTSEADGLQAVTEKLSSLPIGLQSNHSVPSQTPPINSNVNTRSRGLHLNPYNTSPFDHCQSPDTHRQSPISGRHQQRRIATRNLELNFSPHRVRSEEAVSARAGAQLFGMEVTPSLGATYKPNKLR